MSLLAVLNSTYDHVVHNKRFDSDSGLPWPLHHAIQAAHVTVSLNENGQFECAEPVGKDDAGTVVPVTDKSIWRAGTGKLPPHPLNDKIRYCAGDYEADSSFDEYFALLQQWVTFDPTNVSLRAVLAYAEQRSLMADLTRMRIKASKDTFIRFRVHGCEDTWVDQNLRASWINFCERQPTVQGRCMVTGTVQSVATVHPKRLRHAGDNTRIISTNDSDLTMLGQQTALIGAAITQKAHSALRWLIGRQSDRRGEEVFLVWHPGNDRVPQLSQNTRQLCGDYGKSLSDRLDHWRSDWRGHWCLQGAERKRLSISDNIYAVGLDALSKGRLSVVFYRQLSKSDYLDRLYDWHIGHAWFQRYSKDCQFEGAPSPADIIEAAYGSDISDKWRKSFIKRILPCIIDHQPLPRDIVQMCALRVSRPSSMPFWTYEKYLGIACSVVRGYYRKEKYQMGLEENRKTRDYLFGRLWAAAESIEQAALSCSCADPRSTNAAELRARFTTRPASTWLIMDRRLAPYRRHLKSAPDEMWRRILGSRERTLEEITIELGELTDARLSPEWLLGYAAQRRAFATPE